MDRVAYLTQESLRRSSKRRKEMLAPACTADAQQRLDAKAAAAGKVQRTDTEHRMDEQIAADAGTQDSVQTAYHRTQQPQQPQPQQGRRQQQQQSHSAGSVRLQAQQQQHSQRLQQQRQHHSAMDAQEDMEGSGSEVEGPVADDKYIKGTRLIIGGWFQACRGCNEPTAHTTVIGRRDVPLCPRCQGKYNAMIHGCCPPSGLLPDPAVEPLHYWLPRLIGPVPPLSSQQRRDFCDALVLRQDDAWVQLINQS